MKKFLLAVAAAGLLSGCGDPCGDLSKQKAELCKKKMGGNPMAQAPCESQLEQVATRGEKDTCKATIDSYNTK